jgi:hypothetical protein
VQDQPVTFRQRLGVHNRLVRVLDKLISADAPTLVTHDSLAVLTCCGCGVLIAVAPYHRRLGRHSFISCRSSEAQSGGLKFDDRLAQIDEHVGRVPPNSEM